MRFFKISKWALVYFVLAGFDLLTIAGSLTLNHHGMEAFEESLEVNSVWATRLSRFTQLGQLAQQVNAPGNNVFDSGNVEAERSLRNGNLQEFSGRFAALSAEFATIGDEGTKRQLDAVMMDIDVAMNGMIGDADQIFGFFLANDPASAGRLMASMDRSYANVTNAISDGMILIQVVQADNLSTQLAKAEGLKVFEYVIGAIIFLIISAVAIYGHKMGTMMTEAEEKLRMSRDEALAANLQKSNFLSTMSHEIRTPMNGVLGFAQILKHSDLDEEQTKNVDTILSSGQTLLAILNDVLDMSKIEAGALELEDRSFSLNAFLSTIIDPYQTLADDKNLNLTVNSVVPPDCVIKGDPVRLRQVLWNLLSNAIKFTDEGHVTLKVQINSQTNEIDHIAPGLNEQMICFSIDDSGAGISPDRIETVFGAFTQADNTITRKHGGTGLGLTIVSQLVALMGGTVNLTSRVGEGSTFYVHLPFIVSSDEEVDIDSFQPVGTPIVETGPLKVLLAEDNLTNTIVAKAFLEKIGHEVRCVENGKLAVDAAGDGWADFILMDIHMPEMNGIDATKIIRLTERGQTIPIVGLTAEAFKEKHDSFRDAGMNDVLTKPFTEQQLSDVLALNRSVYSLQEAAELDQSDKASLSS